MCPLVRHSRIRPMLLISTTLLRLVLLSILIVGPVLQITHGRIVGGILGTTQTHTIQQPHPRTVCITGTMALLIICSH